MIHHTNPSPSKRAVAAGRVAVVLPVASRAEVVPVAQNPAAAALQVQENQPAEASVAAVAATPKPAADLLIQERSPQ